MYKVIVSQKKSGLWIIDSESLTLKQPFHVDVNMKH